MRLDGLKMIKWRRRPIPYSSPGLGTWVQVLDFLSFVAVVNNILLCTTLTDWPSKVLGQTKEATTTKDRVLLSLAASGILCAMVLLIRRCIPDIPRSFADKIERQRHIEGVLCKKQKVLTDIT